WGRGRCSGSATGTLRPSGYSTAFATSLARPPAPWRNSRPAPSWPTRRYQQLSSASRIPISSWSLAGWSTTPWATGNSGPWAPPGPSLAAADSRLRGRTSSRSPPKSAHEQVGANGATDVAPRRDFGRPGVSCGDELEDRTVVALCLGQRHVQEFALL